MGHQDGVSAVSLGETEVGRDVMLTVVHPKHDRDSRVGSMDFERGIWPFDEHDGRRVGRNGSPVDSLGVQIDLRSRPNQCGLQVLTGIGVGLAVTQRNPEMLMPTRLGGIGIALICRS